MSHFVLQNIIIYK